MRVKNQKPIETILTYRGNDLKRERKTGKSLVGGGAKGIKIMASNYVKCLIQRFLLKFKYIVNTQRERV